MVRHKAGGSTTISITLTRKQMVLLVQAVFFLLIVLIFFQLINVKGSGAFFLGNNSRNMKASVCSALNGKRLDGSASESEIQTFMSQCPNFMYDQVGY